MYHEKKKSFNVAKSSPKCLLERLKLPDPTTEYPLKSTWNGGKWPKMPFRTPYRALKYHTVPFKPTVALHKVSQNVF